jgi:hypothetical protein
MSERHELYRNPNGDVWLGASRQTATLLSSTSPTPRLAADYPTSN